MKKTSTPPENNEVTPSKKKLKQALLPFAVVSDVSPKPDTPPSRKRKLSDPIAEPVTKVGKKSEKSEISEDLVVISDEESRGAPSPKKEDKAVNPYVKLVDTAWKKKLQKSKGQKKGKSKSSKKQTKTAKEVQLHQENGVYSENDDIEMVEVDVLIQEDGEQDSKELVNGNTTTQNIENHSKNNNKSPSNGVTSKEDTEQTPTKSACNKSVENGSTKESTAKTEENVSQVICLEDSNHAADVQMHSITTSVTEKESNASKCKEKQSNSVKKGRKTVTPKRSTRTNLFGKVKDQPKATESPKNKDKEYKSEKESPLSTNNTEAENNCVNDQKSNDSDVEMIDLDEEQKSPKTSESTPKKALQKTDSNDSSSDEKDTLTTGDQSTPKRSTRIKNKTEEADDLDKSIASSKLDESMVSSPCTPKQSELTPDGDKSLNDSIKAANLTPKQLQKKLESAKKREEKEKEKQEREKKRQQEKEERARQRQEKEDQKKKEREEKEEAKRKEREEKEEQKRKEREEKEKLREQERKLKEMKEEFKRKEKEDKEEQKKKEKEAREEEKRKKQEAMELEKQEQELKKKKAAEAFANFFVPKQKVERESSTNANPVSKSSMLSSFTIKSDMRLAPTTRTNLTEEQRVVLDKELLEQSAGNLYLKCLKNGAAKPLSSGKTWPLDDKDDDVMIIEDELPPIDGTSEVIACESAPREKLRPKLLSFHENRRPPYWGTWRKKSKFVTPRRPFGQEKILEYEVDSDDDWEDYADGESLDGSAGGSDEDVGADDYEVDNELFVPHGYLSDEEATMDEEDDVLSLSPETQKARLKHLEDEFESELKKPTEKLKPRLYGLLWANTDGGKPEKCVDALWNYFEKFAMIMNDPTPLMQPAPESEETEKKKTKKKKVLAEVNEQSPKSEKKKKKDENKETKKAKQEAKKTPNQPVINSFLKKVNST